MRGPASADRPSPVSVIIPAHNEQGSIGRLLTALNGGQRDLEVIVVCNGCSDATAQIARSYGVVVQELDEASKTSALQRGHAVATHFPRLYVDADVVLGGASVDALVAALGAGVLATAPRRVVDTQESHWLVRWYYDIWQELPQVQAGLFGRGAIAVSQAGAERLQGLPPVMSDDLAMSEAFGVHERTVVPDAAVHVTAPRTVSGLLKRRVRVTTGNAQYDQLVGRQPAAVTGVATLMDLARRRPRSAPKLLAFAAITLLARMRARRFVRSRDFATWQRDDSSRG